MGEGDSTVSVFDSAPQALEAALAATRALAAEAWPGGLRIAVRFGIHTGEAERRGADYFGPTLNLAARLRGQADGGQIFLSSVTATSSRAHLPDGCELVDLGPHRLKGLGAPEPIHAVQGPGLTHAAARHRVPVPRPARVRARRPRRSSSAARRSSPSSSRRLRPAGCSRSSAHRAAASRRCCAPASSRPCSRRGRRRSTRARAAHARAPTARSTSPTTRASSSSSTSSRSCSRCATTPSAGGRSSTRCCALDRAGRDRRARRLLRPAERPSRARAAPSPATRCCSAR